MKLFNIFVSGHKRWMSDTEMKFETMYKEIYELNSKVQISNIDTAYKKMSNRLMLTVLNVHTEFESRLADINNLDSYYTTQDIILKDKILNLEAVIRERDKEIERLKANEKNIEKLTIELEEGLGVLENSISLIERNKNAITVSERMKSGAYKTVDRSGEKSPRYLQDINTEEVYNNYQKGISYKKQADEYNRKHKQLGDGLTVTEMGLRTRVNKWIQHNK